MINVRDEYKHIRVPAFQYLYKPLSPLKTAVLMMNSAATSAAELTLEFAKVPGFSEGERRGTPYRVYDVWNHRDLGVFVGHYTAKQVASHDAVFLIITKTTGAATNSSIYAIQHMPSLLTSTLVIVVLVAAFSWYREAISTGKRKST